MLQGEIWLETLNTKMLQGGYDDGFILQMEMMINFSYLGHHSSKRQPTTPPGTAIEGKPMHPPNHCLIWGHVSVAVRILIFWEITTESVRYPQSVHTIQHSDDVPFSHSESVLRKDVHSVIVGFCQLCDVHYILSNQLVPANVQWH